MKIGALSLFTRVHCNGEPVRSWNIASWHWPSSLTWRWILSWSRSAGPVRIGFYCSGRNGYRHIGLNTRRFGALSFCTQPNMWFKDIRERA